MTKWRIWILLLCCTCLSVRGKKPPPPEYSPDLETSLRQELLTGYEVMQRPLKKVLVHTTLNLLSLNFLDIKEQKLAMTAYFQFKWIDFRLQWFSNSNYSNIVFIFSNENILWRPAVIIENSVEDVDVISKPQVPMRVRSDGTVIWTPGGVYTTHCEMDVTYYPLDIQTCDIKMSTWAYTANEVSLKLEPDAINMDFYQEHGEWEILDTTFSSQTTKRELQSFSRLKFTIRFRRRPLFHMMNTLFPVILMGFLTVVIFKLPPESGERVGLSLTILLAYAVYLTLISEDIPQTSLSASILSAYLASILLLQTVAVFLTVIFLDIYFTPDEHPVPSCLITFVSCMDCRKNTAKVRPMTATSTDSRRALKSPITISNLDIDVTSINPSRDEKLNECMTNDPQGIQSPERSEIESPWECDDDEVKYTWKDVATALDKLTMYLYLFFVLAVTVISMAIIGFSYAKS